MVTGICGPSNPRADAKRFPGKRLMEAATFEAAVQILLALGAQCAVCVLWSRFNPNHDHLKPELSTWWTPSGHPSDPYQHRPPRSK